MVIQDSSYKTGIIYSPKTATFGDDRLDALVHEASEVSEQIAFIPAPERPSVISKEREFLQSRLRRVFDENTGLLLIAASQFFGSCMNTSVQILNRLDRPVPPTEILVVRQSITWLLTYSYMRYQDIPHPLLGPPEVRHLLVIRGAAGFCGVFGVYYALQYLSLSDATVLTFLSPFFTSFAGTFFLGESFSRRNFFAGLFSLVGVVLIARPEALFGPLASGNETKDSAERGTPHQRLIAVAMSMVGVFGGSSAYISLRAIGMRAHTLHSMNYFALFSAAISFILMIVGKTEPVIPDQWKWGVLLFSISLFGFGAQMLLILGLRKETASRGSLAIYIQIVFASILERVFFHVTPSLLSLFGTFIILGSGLYVGLTKERNTHTPVRRHDRSMGGQHSNEFGESREDATDEQPQTCVVQAAAEAAGLLEDGLMLLERNPIAEDDLKDAGSHKNDEQC